MINRWPLTCFILTIGGSNHINVDTPRPWTTILNINDISADDEGIYTCIVGQYTNTYIFVIGGKSITPPPDVHSHNDNIFAGKSSAHSLLTFVFLSDPGVARPVKSLGISAFFIDQADFLFTLFFHPFLVHNCFLFFLFPPSPACFM